MQVLVHYRVSDGQILGVWQAAIDTLLREQIDVTDSAGYGFFETDVELGELVTTYAVHGEQLHPKTRVTLTATPNPFAADGVMVCNVTVSPFVPCTVLVDGTPYALVEDDAVVMLFAEAPHTFHVELALMAEAMAEPLTVEAT